MDSSESFLKSKRIHVNKSVSVIKMKSPDTIVYEQDSQMALCCSFFFFIREIHTNEIHNNLDRLHYFIF